jgi:hypothetical protein
MFYRQVLRRAAVLSIFGAGVVVTACSEPTAVDGSASSFTADLAGSTTGRLTGSATANAGSDWAREGVEQVTLPNGSAFSGVVLAATDLATTLSFIRAGTELPMGTHRLGRAVVGGFSAGYVVRRPGTLKVFLADSGTVTLAENGNRVSGTFRIYLNTYDVLPIPTPEMVGQPLTPLERGRSPLTISGSFNAGRR